MSWDGLIEARRVCGVQKNIRDKSGQARDTFIILHSYGLSSQGRIYRYLFFSAPYRYPGSVRRFHSLMTKFNEERNALYDSHFSLRLSVSFLLLPANQPPWDGLRGD